MLPATRSFDTAIDKAASGHRPDPREALELAGPDLGEWTAAYPCDIREEGEHIVVEAELPGFKKDQIEVTVEQGVLTIEARREQTKEEKNGKSYLKEREYAQVRRSFRLPKAVDEQKVEAHLEDGLLKLRLAKREQARSKRIEVT